MARPDYAPEARFIGTGALADYSFDFKIEELSQLLIIELDDTGVETERVRGDDVTYLSGVEFDLVNGGGTVTLAANLDTDYTLIILQANDEPTQPSEFREKFSFSLQGFEMALDWLGGAIQRLAWLGGRSVKLNDAYDNDASPIDMQLPTTIVPEAMLRMNDDGDGLDFGPTQTYIEAAYDNALQALQDIADHIADASDAHDASAISVTPVGGLVATDVQTALQELDSDLSTHLLDASDAHDASAISSVAAGNLAATDVQTALDELQSDIDTRALDSDLTDHLLDASDAHDASAISVTPAGNIASTDVQAALEELQDDIDALTGPGGLQASNIEFTPAGTIASTDVQAALEELDGDVVAAQGDATQALSDAADAQTDIDDHIADASGAHAASAIAVTPTGNLAADDVQEALEELQGDIDSIGTNLTSHNVVDGQAAGDLTGETVDSAVYSSAIYEYEIIRGTTVFSTGRLALHYRNSTWRLVLSGDNMDDSAAAHGVTFSLSGTTNAQLRAALDAGAGNGTIKVKKTFFTI